MTAGNDKTRKQLMNSAIKNGLGAIGVLLCALAVQSPAEAQGRGARAPDPIDLSGNWIISYHEDWIEIGTGPDIADYTGLPVNNAARQRALNWHASLVNVPERQCLQLPMEYTNLWSNQRIWQEIDSFSQELVAYRIRKEWGGTERTIWMDKRPHPGKHAPHYFQGFSTGEFVGNKLKITTTHLKEGYARRNGLPRSDQATVVEHFIRHGNQLTISTITNDPIYLTEPLVKTSNYQLNLNRKINPYPCESVTELASMARGYVPHYYAWKNPFLNQFSEKYNIPLEVALGDAKQMYPSFIE
jgi:hypothetical protein